MTYTHIESMFIESMRRVDAMHTIITRLGYSPLYLARGLGSARACGASRRPSGLTIGVCVRVRDLREVLVAVHMRLRS